MSFDRIVQRNQKSYCIVPKPMGVLTANETVYLANETITGGTPVSFAITQSPSDVAAA